MQGGTVLGGEVTEIEDLVFVMERLAFEKGGAAVRTSRQRRKNFTAKVF